ncbi:hypothetical protein VTN49DRAFT_1767 [Thermomyces lanuginosus]|uniref:uncharacterized protein n=1 Tax=Thermomyces lanuginosus TaxID=5541 RepID=UPI003742FE75
MQEAARSTQREQSAANNRMRFESLVDSINRRQWELLSNVVHGRLGYNKQQLSLDEFTAALKHEFAPETNMTLDIVTSLGGDDAAADGPVMARLRVNTQAAEGEHFEYARHMVAHFADGKISHLYDMTDVDEKQSQHQHIVSPPSRCQPPPSPSPQRSAEDMRRFYTDYIGCINRGRIAEELHRYCHPAGVVWNGTHYTVQEYGEMIQSSKDAISGLFFDIHTLVADESQQRLAARLEFTGTPVKSFAGADPNGRPVAFAEHVFYWLEEGKISDVLTIVDWEDYRSQLAH